MKIVPVKHGLEDILGKNPPDFIRTKGVHMSDIYNSYYQDAEPKRFIKGTTPDPLGLEAGLSLEAMLEEQLKKRLTAESGRPGEFIEPEYGIIFSPDLIIFNGSTRMGEIKLSWLSSREVPREAVNSNAFPPKFDKWFTQMKCYGHCLELHLQRLYGFFVNGNYRPPQPELLCWDIEFSRREMSEEWQAMVAHGLQKRIIV